MTTKRLKWTATANGGWHQAVSGNRCYTIGRWFMGPRVRVGLLVDGSGRGCPEALADDVAAAKALAQSWEDERRAVKAPK